MSSAITGAVGAGSPVLASIVTGFLLSKGVGVDPERCIWGARAAKNRATIRRVPALRIARRVLLRDTAIPQLIES
jgi:hypothetical protein